MYDGYLQLGGDELANKARFKKYIEDSGFPWVKPIPQAEADALRAALGDAPYTTPAGDNAPWYDPADPASANFWGLYVTGISGDEDSTRTATTTQAITAGGTSSVPRNGTREMRVTAVLAARDELAMESGMKWLNRVLDPADCAPDVDCGVMTLCGYAVVPGYLDSCDPWDYPASVIRTNETVDPMFVNGSTYWTPAAAGSAFNSSGSFANFALTTAAGSLVSLFYERNIKPAAAGDVISGRITVTNRNATAITLNAQIATYLATAAVGSTNGAAVSIPAGGTAVLTVDGAAIGAGVDGYRLLVRASAAGVPANSLFSVSRAQTVKEPTAGAFFYGSGTPSSEDHSNVWTGKPNASASMQFRAGVNAARHLNEITVISGATVNTKRSMPNGVVREIEFGISAGTPWFFGDPMSVLSGTTDAAGATTFYDDGRLVSINHLFDPRAVSAANWVSSGAAGTLTYLFTSPVTAGIPGYANSDSRTMRYVASAAGASYDIGPATAVPPMRPVVAGNRYVASVHVTGNFVGSIRLRIDWYNGSGSLIGSTPGTLQDIKGNATPSLAVFTRYSTAGDAPAGAVYGVPVVTLLGTSGGALANGNTFYVGWWQFEEVRVLANMPADSPTDWFDGASYFGTYYSKSTREQFEWSGAANASASYHFQSWLCDYVLYNGAYYPADYTPLLDPLAGTIPAPPAPPAITPTIPVVGLTGWSRSYFQIPAVGSTENGISVPTIRLSTVNTPSFARQVRIRFYPNPNGLAAADIDPCAYCAELIVSYVSNQSAFIIDGEVQRIFATIYGNAATIPADGYVYGADGGPVIWPELTCGIPFVMTVDQRRDASANLNVAVDLTRRL